MVNNKWYALVAALFGISSAFNAYRYVKDKYKKGSINDRTFFCCLTV